ncbi:hypothetical protein ABZZ17_32810 [Streptomyces sp. NPDC006512]|uniref:hypothetical protein n=1 Tax=Streptomyces sp. NPDC006512 TaxID=3154307 RepID=UPI0033B935B2
MTTSTPQAAFLGEPGPPEPEPHPRPAPEARPPRRPGHVAAAVLSALLGTGLLAGAAATAWSEHRAAHRPLPPDAAYRQAASLWRSAPVDSLFPPVLDGPEAGPGGAARSWTRTALAPDADCGAALAPDWRAALAAAGCTRVLRATYTDSTRSSLITVGLVFTPADSATMDGLRGRLPAPPAYAYADTRRAAWSTAVVAGAPVLVYTVSAFADGRSMDAPVPAEEAAAQGATGVVAEAGLGYEAKALAARFERGLATLAAPPASTPPPTATAAR